MVDAEQPADREFPDADGPGAGRMRWPFKPGDHGGGQAPRLVCRGEAGPLVEEFRRAEELAARVRRVFARVGLGAAVAVTPGLEEESGRACVYVLLDGSAGRAPVWLVLVPAAAAYGVRVRLLWQRRAA